MNMKKVLIACPGYRDPFVCPGHDVRPSSAAPDREAANQAITDVSSRLRHRFDWTRLEEAASPGPMLTALRALEQHHNWMPDRVIAPFLPSPDMNVRLSALARILEALKVQMKPLPMESVRIAEYGSARECLMRALSSELRTLVDAERTNLKILVGPATPALNFALLLLPYSVLPNAEVVQVLNPVDLQQANRKIEAEEFQRRPIAFLRPDGQSLPYLQVDETPSPEVLQLRKELATMRHKLDLAETRAERADRGEVAAPDPITAQAERQKQWLLAALEEELAAAAAESRKPNPRLAAQAFGRLRGDAITRQGFLDRLEANQIALPAAFPRNKRKSAS
jgi:hypothetical protein